MHLNLRQASDDYWQCFRCDGPDRLKESFFAGMKEIEWRAAGENPSIL
jgi:hypothetical protein